MLTEKELQTSDNYLRNNHPFNQSYSHNEDHYWKTIQKLKSNKSLRIKTFLALESCENFYFLDEVITRFNYQNEIYIIIKNIISEDGGWDSTDIIGIMSNQVTLVKKIM